VSVLFKVDPTSLTANRHFAEERDAIAVVNISRLWALVRFDINSLKGS